MSFISPEILVSIFVYVILKYAGKAYTTNKNKYGENGIPLLKSPRTAEKTFHGSIHHKEKFGVVTHF